VDFFYAENADRKKHLWQERHVSEGGREGGRAEKRADTGV